jgi:ribosome-binding protein 1
MDIQIPFIFVSLFSLASVVLIFIYKFGIKEKSYEEALAEQRHQSHILLGIKPKSKEKKNKKITKKFKEKLGTEENEAVDEPEVPESAQKNADVQKKLHVEFKEAPEDVSSAKVIVNKKQTKKEKVRPILIHKEKSESECVKITSIDSVIGSANHFEELQPKDDFELFRSVGGEERLKDDVEKNTDTSTGTEGDTQKQVHKKQQETVTVVSQKENNPPIITSSINGFIGNTGKEKKKKKSEFNTLQQLAGDTNSSNISILLNLVRKAELSRSEVQVLIDLLLNKQHEAPVVLDEWSEGKSDPVQKLKKQLAEKDKLILEEKQIVASTQTKLREIRSEHQNEKTALQQIIHKKQKEVTQLDQQIQQLQTQIQEEVMKNHKLREEYATIQMQRQQFEMRLSQVKESEGIINQLQNDIQELSSINDQLRMESLRLNEENIAEKERSQSCMLQMNNFKHEFEQKTERNRQLEETCLNLEHDLENMFKQENDLKSEVSHLNTIIQQQNDEIKLAEHCKKQYLDDLQKHKNESNKLISQLKADLRQAQEETLQLQVTQVNGTLQENKQHEVEILNLHNELSSVKTQLMQAQKKTEMDVKIANATIEGLRCEIVELNTKLEEEKSKLEKQTIKNNQTKSNKDVEREFIQRLFPEIKDQEITNADIFAKEGENFIKKYVHNLQNQTVKGNDDTDIQQLKSQLQHYKNVIDNTEKMLNKLQKHIEQEEITWRMELAAKTAELESIKELHGHGLLEKLTRLEEELKKEQEDKQNIIAQLQKYKNGSQTERGLLEAQNSPNGVH